MNNILSPGQLLAQYQLTENTLEDLLKTLAKKRIDDGDIYFQSVHTEGMRLEEGIIKENTLSYAQGVGIRACVEDKTGFAYSAEIEKNALLQAAKAAHSIAANYQTGSIAIVARQPSIITPSHYMRLNPLNPLESISADQKVSLLTSIDKLARQLDPRIKHVIAQLMGSFETILIMNLDGTLSTDIRPLVRLNVTVVAEENHQTETGSFGGGGRVGYAVFTDDVNHIDGTEKLSEFYVKEAVRQAIQNLTAKPAPAGPMPVVLGPGWPGVLLHEAVGHGLEGDFNRKGTSNFSHLLGQKVASNIVTVVDDGTLQDKRGSLNIDDEGTPTQRTVLIENGVLKNYLQDRLNARLMKTQSTGNGRRQSYAHIPMPRMTNTFMLPGKHTHEEIIASVPYGIYAEHFGGGSVDITSGNFVFSASSAYLIENGKITTPIKGATLIGQGPEIMKKIKMVGNNLALDTGIGNCGKEGQTVPVGVGMPTVLVEEMTVGGTHV